MTFRELAIGQEFDFVGANPTFYKRCHKISARKYRDEDGDTHTVGSVLCDVYNVAPGGWRIGDRFDYFGETRQVLNVGNDGGIATGAVYTDGFGKTSFLALRMFHLRDMNHARRL